MTGIDPIPRLPLGETIVTPGAAGKLDAIQLKLAIAPHAAGNWGELDAEDRRSNDERLAKGGTLVSTYKTAASVKFYVITEAERNRATILLPEEY